MKNRIYLLALCLALPAMVPAQQEINQDTKLALFEEFIPGSIYFNDGQTENALLNYDTSTEHFLFMSDGQIMELGNLQDIIFINVNGRFFENVRGGQFYEKIATDEEKDLYVLWRSKVTSKGKKGAYGYSSLANISTASNIGSSAGGRSAVIDPTKAEALSIEPINTYFIKDGDSFKGFTSEKSILKLFKGHEDEISTFISDNAIDFGKVDDMKKLVDFVSQFLG